MIFQGAAGGGCLKPASGSVVSEGRGPTSTEMKANYQEDLILASLISTSCIYMNGGFQEEAVFGGQGCVCVRVYVYFIKPYLVVKAG